MNEQKVQIIHNMNLLEKDRKFIWHPFTQEKTADPPTVIVKGEGSYVIDNEGNKLLDMVSSWWVNLHGHANKEISDAIYRQCCTLEHVMFAGFTHKPAIELCELLSSILPPSLEKFFFTDNGSTAVETAMKMAYQAGKNKGVEKPLFLCFEGGYHGDTWGAMSVGVTSGFHDPFKKVLFPIVYLPFAETWIDDDEIETKEQNALKILEQKLQENSDRISALVIEPLIQGASGMRMCRPQFIDKVVKIVRSYGIFVIFDEVMTGFGRTGTYFALQQLNVVPDFLCISKGITGGFLPLSLTITTVEIYQRFLGNSFDTAFAHGHSYTGNAVGCAAAIASFKRLISPVTSEAIKEINLIHRSQLQLLQKECKCVTRIRVTGTVAAFDVDQKVDLKVVMIKCRKDGVIIRPLNRSIYLLPPYCTTASQLKHVYDVLISNLNSSYAYTSLLSTL